MASIRLSVLDVGQGTGTLLEYFAGNDTTKPSQAMLIDLGTTQETANLGVPSAKYVAARLKKMGTPATLEAVFLSHPDKDHMNLTGVLTAEFTTAELKINNIWYGGDRHGYVKGSAKFDYLANLDRYKPSSKSAIQSPGVSESGITDQDQSNWKALATMGAGAVKVYLLVGNTLYGSPDKFSTDTSGPKLDGYRKNCSSLVLLVRYANENIVVMGDATGLTMQDANRIVGKRNLKAFSLALPHHGSITSAFDLAGAKDQATANLIAFITAMGSRTISASAWEFSNWHHPHIEIVDGFSAFLNGSGMNVWSDPTAATKTSNKLHFMTAWLPAGSRTMSTGPKTSWPSAEGWYSMRTEAPVFTTDYFKPGTWEYPTITPPSKSAQYNAGGFILPAPRRAIAWAFEVDGTTLTIRPVVDKSSIAALAHTHPFRVAAGPLPEEDDFVILPVVAPEDAADPPPPTVRPRGQVLPRTPPPGRLRRLRAVD
jgi:beta-lactamase superfamily II metal-dependent hydrolase